MGGLRLHQVLWASWPLSKSWTPGAQSLLFPAVALRGPQEISFLVVSLPPSQPVGPPHVAAAAPRQLSPSFFSGQNIPVLATKPQCPDSPLDTGAPCPSPPVTLQGCDSASWSGAILTLHTRTGPRCMSAAVPRGCSSPTLAHAEHRALLHPS